MTTKPLFEADVCTRCGGSGHYSRCDMYGTTCFRCAGRGYTLTKRGEAAEAYYTTLCSLPAQDVKPGMVVQSPGDRRWHTITFVGYQPHGSEWCGADGTWHPYYYLKAADWCYGTFPEVHVRIQQAPEAQQQKREQALAYQASLGKNGKPRKAA